jgi:hypothetical protein
MTMRLLSSETLSETTSAARRAAPQATFSAALCLSPSAAFNRPATSSELSTTSGLRGSWMNAVCSMMAYRSLDFLYVARALIIKGKAQVA